MREWVSTVNYRISHRLRHGARGAANEASRVLEESLRRIGLPGPVPPQIRQAFWGTSYGYRKGWTNLLAWLLVLAGVLGLTAAGRLLRSLFPPARPVVAGVVGLLLGSTLVLFFLSLAINSSKLGWLGTAVKWSQVGSLTNVVNRCGAALAVGPRSRPDHLMQVSTDLRLVETAPAGPKHRSCLRRNAPRSRIASDSAGVSDATARQVRAGHGGVI
ncbi:hypothetical protein [Kitasatospora sp. NPDC001527]|uniref:hypothetical protein n=1 Tax=Kitasatospora sp. NPDC001527 TaxID=3154519 RepID=UPI003320ABA5